MYMLRRFSVDQIRIAEPRDSLGTFGLILVDVDLDLHPMEHVGRALHVMTHHRAAEMVGMVMRDENLVDFVAVALSEVENCADVPCGVDHRGLMRCRVADQVNEIRHRPNLGLFQVKLCCISHRVESLTRFTIYRYPRSCRVPLGAGRCFAARSSSIRSPRSHRNSGSSRRFATHRDCTNRWSLRRLMYSRSWSLTGSSRFRRHHTRSARRHTVRA